MCRRQGCLAGLAAILAMGCPTAAVATPSGLNNIPTADVVAEQMLVLQAFTEFGREREPSWFGGLKYGPSANWEVGLDDTSAGSGSAGGPVLQAKYRRPVGAGTAVALGMANISDDTDRNGEVFPYAVVSAPVGPPRWHLGYAPQRSNHAWFVGLDQPVSRELTVRADWTQVADGEESVSSVGFISGISSRWLIEGWASFPTAADAETSYIVKLDFVVPLSDH